MDATTQPKNARTHAIENPGLECCISEYVSGCKYLSPEDISEKISEKISEPLVIKYSRNFHFKPEEYRDIIDSFQKGNPYLKEKFDSLTQRLFHFEKNILESFPRILIFYMNNGNISPESLQTYLNIHSRALEIYRAIRKEYAIKNNIEVISR